MASKDMKRPNSFGEDSDDSCLSITDILNELEDEKEATSDQRVINEMGQKNSRIPEDARETSEHEMGLKNSRVARDQCDGSKVVAEKQPGDSDVAKDLMVLVDCQESLGAKQEKQNHNESAVNRWLETSKAETTADATTDPSVLINGVADSDRDNESTVNGVKTSEVKTTDSSRLINDFVDLDRANEQTAKESIKTSEAQSTDDDPSFISHQNDDVDFCDDSTLHDGSADTTRDTINQFLDGSSVQAEARLLAKRAARAEAREIRMRDLERQQREQEENADRQFDMLAEPIVRRPASTSRYHSSRRSSEDSLEDTGSLRDLRHELKEVEEKFRKAMIANAQLDNDKAAQTYQLELLKDRLEESEENHSQLKREHREKCRDFEQLKRLTVKLKEELALVHSELEDRDRLIAEKGMVIVGEEEPVCEENGETLTNGPTRIRRVLVSAENAQFLENAGEGSLDVRLAKLVKERGELQDLISHLKLELEDEKSKRRKHSGATLNGPSCDSDYDAADIQREASKQLAEFKFRAQKAEQDVATLQATVARLESQVIRYKSASEISEKSEEALKAEKRKLQREAREAQNRAEELEMSNTHLIKRLDKLKNAKSALLKEL